MTYSVLVHCLQYPPSKKNWVCKSCHTAVKCCLAVQPVYTAGIQAQCSMLSGLRCNFQPVKHTKLEFI